MQSVTKHKPNRVIPQFRCNQKHTGCAVVSINDNLFARTLLVLLYIDNS